MEIERYPIEPRKLWIKDLYQMYKQGTLILNPEFQRSYVWKEFRGKRERLIDSMLRDFDIGKIFLREIIKIIDGRAVVTYECLDGQQRLRSIFDFIDGEYTTSSKITKELGSPKKFSDLEPRYQVKIRDIQIEPVVVRSDNDEMISDIFMRLQEGVPLKGPEKLNAERGFMRNIVVELSKHDFFGKTSIKPYRFAYRYLVAQIMRLEEQNVLDSLNFVNVGYEELLSMYQRYRDRDETKVKHLAEKVKSNLNFLSRVLNKDASAIGSKGDAISIYLLTSYVRDKYAISEKENEFKDFVMNFLQDVAYSPKSAYGVERRSTTSGKTIKEMFNSILQKFLEFTPDLRLKDDKRLFDWGQKLAIYSRQKGKCKRCGKPVDLKAAQFHHIWRYEDGGPTTVKNGEMYHPKCHPR